MHYGPVLAAAFVLWPVLAALGGQGFAALAGLTGIAALAIARPAGPPRGAALLLLLFVAWAVTSEFWGPRSEGILSGSLRQGNFAIESRAGILIGTVAAALLTLAGAARTGKAPRAERVILGGIGVQAGLLIAGSVAIGPILLAVYGSDPQRQYEGIQNFSRNANAFALALPLLAAPLLSDGAVWRRLAAAGLMLVAAAVFIRLDAQSALVALVATAIAWGIVTAFPRLGLRWLIGLSGGYIAAAPLLIGGVLHVVEPFADRLPPSFRSRLWAWETVLARTAEAPFSGHGLGATRTWRETFAAHPDWLAGLPPHWANYPVVPGHPHNMALEIWAETGATGAVLAALALVVLAFRLPDGRVMTARTRLAAAGLTAAALAIFSFAYSVWNEAFWAGLILLAAALILMARTQAARAHAA